MAALLPSACIPTGRNTWHGTDMKSSLSKTTRSRIRSPSTTEDSTSAFSGTRRGKSPSSSSSLGSAFSRHPCHSACELPLKRSSGSKSRTTCSQ